MKEYKVSVTTRVNHHLYTRVQAAITMMHAERPLLPPMTMTEIIDTSLRAWLDATVELLEESRQIKTGKKAKKAAAYETEVDLSMFDRAEAEMEEISKEAVTELDAWEVE